MLILIEMIESKKITLAMSIKKVLFCCRSLTSSLTLEEKLLSLKVTLAILYVEPLLSGLGNKITKCTSILTTNVGLTTVIHFN